MASTAPSASGSGSSPAAAECVVCGTTCWTRCSQCTASGLDWMYFCSREHQKLVWCVHRRVCGQHAKLFVWPKLSPAEVAQASQAGRLRVRKNDGGITSVADEYHADSGNTFESVLAVVASPRWDLTGDVSCLEDIAHSNG
ncbi:hypothetical protein JCM11491_001341 [Sporobolomyces phaffii]